MDQETCNPAEQAEFLEKKERKKQKKQVSRLGWTVFFPCAVFFLVTQFLAEILFFVTDNLGLPRNEVSKTFSDAAAKDILQIGLSLTLLTVPFLLAYLVSGNRLSQLEGFKRPEKGTVLPHLFFGLGFCAFANIAVYSAEQVFKRFGYTPPSSKSALPQGVFGFMIAVISSVLIPALVEEFAFRGIIIGILKPFGEVFAILGSAAAFGLLHGNFEQIPFAFLVGLVLGYIRIKSGSIAVCMAVHGINNLISVVLSYLKTAPAWAVNTAYATYIILVLIAAVAGLALIKGKEPFAFDPPKRKITPKETYVGFFLSPGMIILFLLFLYRSLTYLKL
ncbi:MAG: CPBP family intramembrane metalloprotease [Clostridia bacterium]|nr:CPBP family intramembrane metalloprotease [Clostridia bacterium]